MVLQFGRWIHDTRWGVIGVWVLIVVLLRIVAPSWSQVAMDGDLEYLPPDTTTVRAAELKIGRASCRERV